VSKNPLRNTLNKRGKETSDVEGTNRAHVIHNRDAGKLNRNNVWEFLRGEAVGAGVFNARSKQMGTLSYAGKKGLSFSKFHLRCKNSFRPPLPLLPTDGQQVGLSEEVRVGGLDRFSMNTHQKN